MENLRSLPEAVSYLNDLFAAQLERAEEYSILPNEPAVGDSRAREAFLTLLPPDEQRRFFLRLIGNRRYWPRLRTLVGSPPYSFLRSEDEGVLRASGIASHRTNMAHSETQASSYSDFACGHFEDAAGRLYRVVAKEFSGSQQLPWIGLVPGAKLVADVRVQKRSVKIKSAIAKGSHGSAAQLGLVFPRVGDTLRLRLVAPLRASSSPSSSSTYGIFDENDNEDDTLRARVDMGRQRAPRSPVARLVLSVT